MLLVFSLLSSFVAVRPFLFSFSSLRLVFYYLCFFLKFFALRSWMVSSLSLLYHLHNKKISKISKIKTNISIRRTVLRIISAITQRTAHHVWHVHLHSDSVEPKLSEQFAISLNILKSLQFVGCSALKVLLLDTGRGRCGWGGERAVGQEKRNEKGERRQ